MRTIDLITSGLLIACLHAAGHAEQPRFLGYWANSGMMHENHDHTNITHVGVSTNDRALAMPIILDGLAEAQANGVRAIVTVTPFVFVMSGPSTEPTGRPECPFSNQPNSDIYFDELVGELISHGYLLPNNPGASIVAAFLPVDEPEDCGLRDETIIGPAHPALENAVDTIRNNPHAGSFPLYLNVTRSYGSVVHGMQLFDWVSMVAYGQSTEEYIRRFNCLSVVLDKKQRTVLLPQASHGGFMESFGQWHNPWMIYDKFMADAQVIGIIPFLWDHGQTTGTRDIPELHSAYRRIGRLIKSGAIYFDRFEQGAAPAPAQCQFFQDHSGDG